MRRTVISAAVLSMTVAAVLPAVAADRGGARTVTRVYTLGAPTDEGPVAFVGDQDFGFVMAHARSGDRRLSISMTDRTGQPVQAFVDQWRGGHSVGLGVICGGTDKALRLRPGGGTIEVRPTYGACGTTPSAPTTGTVSFRFSR
jgi:hypothetical protein